MPRRITIAVLTLALIACTVLIAGDATIKISDESKQPVKIVRMVKPQYPPEAKEARIQGTVCLRAVVDKDGTVKDIKVIEGHPKLAEASVEAVRQWVYEPAQADGKTVEAIVEVRLNFALSE